jgi:hypothetical protein
MSLNLASVINPQKFHEYSLTYHSTAIEGSSLTEIEVRLLLDEGITPKGKLLDSISSRRISELKPTIIFSIGSGAIPLVVLSRHFITSSLSYLRKAVLLSALVFFVYSQKDIFASR